MNRNGLRTVLLAIASTATAATTVASCGSHTPQDTVADLCVRADECNILNGSVDECIDYIGGCVDRLTDGQQNDWTDMIDDCLGYDSCALAVDCYNQVPWC